MSDQPDPSPPPRTGYLLDEIRDVRAEVRSVRSDLRGEIRELRGEIQDLRTETRAEIGSLRGEMRGLRSELRGEIRTGLNRVTATTGVPFAALAVLVTVVQFTVR